MPSPEWHASMAVLIPGGIKPTDHWHVGDNDNTCSRCRKEVPEEDVPLLLFRDRTDGACDMLIYCSACMAWERPEPREGEK